MYCFTLAAQARISGSEECVVRVAGAVLAARKATVDAAAKELSQRTRQLPAQRLERPRRRAPEVLLLLPARRVGGGASKLWAEEGVETLAAVGGVQLREVHLVHRAAGRGLAREDVVEELLRVRVELAKEARGGVALRVQVRRLDGVDGVAEGEDDAGTSVA